MRLDSAHLSKGGREYLKEQNLSLKEFDRLNQRGKQEWMNEMKNPKQDHMRNWEKKQARDWAEAHLAKRTN